MLSIGIRYSGNISPQFLPSEHNYRHSKFSSLLLFSFLFSFFLQCFDSSFFLVFCQVLKLQACKYLADSSLEPLYKEGALPALCELELSYGTLCQSAIEELLAYCTRLTHVSLNGCANMHDLNWGCSSDQLSEQPDRLLQNLNCVGCPNIKKVVIPQLARCFHLSSLNLSLSANLREVDIACFNLCFLNLRYEFLHLCLVFIVLPVNLICLS